ncbi:TolC family protein [Enterobacteriaceae bacterium LUAb1]
MKEVNFLKRKKVGLLSLVVIFILSFHQAQATTLLEAIQSAGAKNAKLQVAVYQQLTGKEKYHQGLAGLLPEIQLTGSYNLQDQPGATWAAKVKRHNYSISLNQPLFDLSKYADYLRGKALEDHAHLELINAQQELAYTVSDAYADVLYQREIYHAAQAATQVYSTQLQQAISAVQLGDATQVDRDEAQANYDLYQAKEIEAQSYLSVAGEKYHRLTGLDYHDISNISAHCLLKKTVNDSKEEPALWQHVLAHNASIRVAMAQWNVTKTGVYRANSAHLPTVSLQASYGTNWSRAEDSNYLDEIFGSTSKTTNTNITLAVSVPLFTGGRQLSQSREAVYIREQARYALIDSRQKAQEELRSALLKIKNGQMLVMSTQRVIRSEQQKINSTSVGKTLGLRTQLDELNAYQSYYEAVRNNAEARYKLLMAKIARDKVLGELGHRSIAQITCLQ